ncbi:hypothetical protein HPP92_016240 [Vanilla planifolia]|uniref:Uncharacterized protein n=1 Tax=Vanilla planifolia TaxID=51239 RepID=A0A835UR26_VANPL|nr:hypothetical protein HPP92_016225 [Vanilla planifolia]KAG0469540.1 hypothetical protein HPP92_016240 [Vanilla planifolia]
MAKHGKLSMLRCMIKRWHSSSRTASVCGGEGSVRSHDNDAWQAASFHGDEVPPGFRPVYVGKSRRRYLVSSCLVDHPLFKNLVDDSDGEAVVGCEVVLFDHLLWMLENAEPQPESLDDLVDFYAC